MKKLFYGKNIVKSMRVAANKKHTNKNNLIQNDMED